MAAVALTESILHHCEEDRTLRCPWACSCSTTSFQGYKAEPITPPQDAGVCGSYTCIVDFGHKPFSITWEGSPDYPNLAGFPRLKDVCISPVRQSHNMAAIWSNSTPHDYGSHASIRTTQHSHFPILKLAHSDYQSIKLIQHEFDILANLTTLDLPVVEVGWLPITDNGVIYGYRMRELFKLELSELHSRRDDIRDAVRQLHSAGFCHGDLTPSNVMKDVDDHITLIDFGFAGRIGSTVPSFIPSWVYGDGTIRIDVDLKALDRYVP